MNRGMELKALLVALVLVLTAGTAQAGYNPKPIKVEVDKTVVALGDVVTFTPKYADGTPITVMCDFRIVTVSDNTVVATGNASTSAPYAWKTSAAGVFKGEVKSPEDGGWVPSAGVTVVRIVSIVASGPIYGPPEFELGDQITYTATTEPAGEGAALVTWSGDGVSGTGLVKQVSYSATGTKTVTANCGVSYDTKAIYVNKNAAAPISGGSITIVGKSWAHHASETISLEASGATDYDWVNGQEDTSTNRVDWTKSSWEAPAGWGTCAPVFGQSTVWTPPVGKASSAVTITCHVEDEDDYYSPRDETNKTMTKDVGCFIVRGTLQQITRVDGVETENVSYTIDDTGAVISGTAPAAATGNVSLSADAYNFPNRSSIGPIELEKEVYVLMNWKAHAYPGEAVPSGNIYLDVGTSGSASGWTQTGDSDYWDGNDGQIEVTFGAEAYGFGFSVNLATITWGNDGSEGAAALAAGFSSELGFLGGSQQPTHVKSQSSDYSDIWYVGAWFPAETLDPLSVNVSSANLLWALNATKSAEYHFWGRAQAYNSQSPVSDNPLPFAAGKTDMPYSGVGKLNAVKYQKP